MSGSKSSNTDSESGSDFSSEIIKSATVRYRKGSFGRWRSVNIILTGNGRLCAQDLAIQSSKKSKKNFDMMLGDCDVEAAELITGKKNSITIVSLSSQFFVRFSAEDEYNIWLHVLKSYAKKTTLESYELSEDAVVISDIKGVVITVNNVALEMFGYIDRAEVLGKNVSILMPDSIAASHPGFMSRYEKGAVPRLIGKSREMVGKRKDGSEFSIFLSLGEISSGNSRNFIAHIKDYSKVSEVAKKGETTLRKIQSNITNIIDEQSKTFHTIVNDALEREFRQVVTMSQQLREDLDVIEQENNNLLRKNNQMSTIINTFKSLSDEPQSFFNINHLLTQITKEIENSVKAEILFRTDSIVTRHLTLFCMLYGMGYLERVIGPFVFAIANNQRYSFDLSPASFKTQEKYVRRCNRLKSECNTLLNTIYSSVEYMPIEICRLADILYSVTKRTFPGFEHSITSGCLILRWLCPSMISPESFGLLSDSTDMARRNLITISKYVQYAANGADIEDGHSMYALRDSLNVNMEKMKTWVENVAAKGSLINKNCFKV